MNTNLPTRDRLTAPLKVCLAADAKQRLFRQAASRGKSVSEMIREAVDRMLDPDEPRAA